MLQIHYLSSNKKQLLVRFSLFADWESQFSVVIIQLRFCLGKAISLLCVFSLFYPVCFYLNSLYISSFLFGCFTMVPFLLGLLPPLHSICLIDLIIPCIDEVIFLCRQLTQFLLMLRISQFSYWEVISSLLFGSREEICAGFVVVDSFRLNRFMFNW